MSVVGSSRWCWRCVCVCVARPRGCQPAAGVSELGGPWGSLPLWPDVPLMSAYFRERVNTGYDQLHYSLMLSMYPKGSALLWV